MSLCDRCFAPGHCCKRLDLSTPNGPVVVWEGDDPVETLAVVLRDPDHPFRPLERRGTWSASGTGQVYSAWAWFCVRLMPDGRCGDYENRPALCRDYQPLADPLCVHFGGAEAGDASVGLE